MSRIVLSGNEAIARGALEAGVQVATGYPGTPSTEILETIARTTQIDAQWSPNEKVALEVGIGAAFCGARVIVTMKHVGLNVAADPLFTMAYTGTKGGLVVVVADDPGMHSSQNEQDSRNYAAFAKIPMLEPSSSQEAKDLMVEAFEISEQYDTPVLLRMTTRICHGKSIVEEGPVREPNKDLTFDRQPKKYVMIPAFARMRRVDMQKRLKELAKFSEKFSGQCIEMNGSGDGKPELGIITSSITYQYAKEVMPDAAYLKLGMTNPLPMNLIRDFVSKVKDAIVLEELDPFMEDQLRAAGIKISAKGEDFQIGELDPDRVNSILTGQPVPKVPEVKPKPPVLCAGCPHRGIFTIMKKLKLFVTGDIGCYTLGVLQPMGGMDMCVCMGASIGGGFGFEKALGRNGTTVAVLGDSTFFHSGVTGLMDMVYNGGSGTVLILDNRLTAMTGGQQNPGTGKDIRGQKAPEINIPDLCRALGVKDVRVTNPWDLESLEKELKEALAFDGVSVVINEGPCALLDRSPVRPKKVDEEVCKACGLCIKSGCPALIQKGGEGEKGKVAIDPLLCRSCGVCVDLCPFDAIE